MSVQIANINMSAGILMLNDYCFLEIFKHLSVIDLANFKEIYGNFLGDIVDMEFARKTCGSFFFGCRDRMDKALQIIRQFGSSINELTINYHGWYEREWSEIFSVINERCNKTLKTLALCGDSVGLINADDVSLIADVLENIETLELKNLNCEVRTNYSQDFVNILMHCVNAKSIALISYIDIDVSATVFKSTKNLTNLKLRGLRNLKAIVDGLVNGKLEELTISSMKVDTDVTSYNRNFSQLFRLNRLKRLCIDSGYMDISSVLMNLDATKSLNVLSLSNAELNLDTEIMARMTGVKVLKLRHCCLTTKFPFESVLLLCGQRNFEHLILLCYREPICEVNFLQLIANRRMSTGEKRLHLTLMTAIYDRTIEAIPCELLATNQETITLIDDADPNYEFYGFDRGEYT